MAKVNIDMWYGDNQKEADKIDVVFIQTVASTEGIYTKMGKQSVIIPVRIPYY